MQNKVYHNVEQITGNVIVVKADDVIAGELAQVESEFGTSLAQVIRLENCLLYTSPSPRDRTRSRMPSSA